MGKRGNGQGSARKRGKTWTAIWTLGTVVEDGRLRQIRQTKGGFRTKTEALAYAANPPQIAAQASTPSLMDYWTVWSATSLSKMSKSKQTAYKIAKRKVERIMLLPVDKLSINLLQETVDAKAPTYYPAKDIKTLLTHLYKRAVAEGWVSTNLAEFIVLPALEEEELQPFTEPELRQFWAAYGAGDSFVGFILLMIYTGMMPGELFGLKKDMIDWDACEIRGCGLKTKKRKETPIDRAGPAGSLSAVQQPNRKCAVYVQRAFLSGVSFRPGSLWSQGFEAILLSPHDGHGTRSGQHCSLCNSGGHAAHEVLHHPALHTPGYGCRPCSCGHSDPAKRRKLIVHYRVRYYGVHVCFSRHKTGFFTKFKKQKSETQITKKVTGNAHKKHFRLLGAEGGI